MMKSHTDPVRRLERANDAGITVDRRPIHGGTFELQFTGGEPDTPVVLPAGVPRRRISRR
jgi:hypothetical protein